MKKLLSGLFLALAMFSSSVFAQLPPYGIYVMQADVGGTFFWGRYFTPPNPSDSYFMLYDGATQKPAVGALGGGISWNGTTLDVGSISLSQVTGLNTSLASKFNTPTGTTSQYVRGDGSLAALPGSSTFNYGDPVVRTLALSTSYQATDTSKAAVLTVSPSCRNQTTLVAASACTLQVRQHTSAVTCSTGTVVSTWSSSVALGLLFDQTSGSPFDIKLGAGRYFILCPTAGTFSVTTSVDQTVS